MPVLAFLILLWLRAWAVMLVLGMAHAQTSELPALSYAASLCLVVCVDVAMSIHSYRK